MQARAAAGCLGTIVRWAIVVGFFYVITSSVGLWPDIVRLVGSVVRGEQVDVRPIVNRVRSVFDLPPLDDSPSSSPRRTPE